MTKKDILNIRFKIFKEEKNDHFSHISLYLS